MESILNRHVDFIKRAHLQGMHDDKEAEGRQAEL